MAFIGTPLDTRNTFQSLVGKRFNGDGSTTAFTLDVAPSSTLDIEVFVGNVRQDPNSAYTLSGTTLTFTGAPPSGTNNIYVVHQAKSVGTIDPPATETIAKTFSGATTISGALVASSTAQFDTIGVGAAKDLGNGLHVKTADSGQGSVDTNADELVLEGSAGAGMTILSGTSNLGRIAFGDSGATMNGRVQYDHTNDSLDFYTSGTEHMSIDSAGHVTMPKQSAFSAQSNSTLSNVPTNNAVQTIPFGTEIFDLNADYNNSNYTFTAPVTGKYLLTFCAVLANVDKDANYIICAIRTSNRQYGDGNAFGIQQNGGDEPRMEISQTILADMDANDTATVGVQQYEGAAQMDITDDTAFFMGHLVA